MQRAKAFFYVCAGLFLLALSYHLGARNAGAQAPGNPVVAVSMTSSGGFTWLVAFTANGDYYRGNDSSDPWVYRGNVFGGSPTPAQRESFGALKSRYRGERGAAQPSGGTQP